MKTSLDVLADAATSPLACYDSYDESSSLSSSSSSSSSVWSSPTACYDFRGHSPSSSRRSSGSEPSSRPLSMSSHQLRPRKKAAHKSPKSSRSLKPSPELKVRRKELMDRACGIDSLSNSPANDCQLHVLKTVFDEITMYPSEPWLALMAVILHRSLRQIKNWFSNERQKHRWGDVVSTQMNTGERLRLRPSAIDLCEQWDDAFFEEVIMIVNYRTTRRLQWERMQALNKLIVKSTLNDQGTDTETSDTGSDEQTGHSESDEQHEGDGF
ncbi:hypothetical protein MSAN_02175800 [Mycena sanguinolenta]|uniref:Homeobox domain-containing protein n=1 Tax=Mycena sanguinolenta TaxID=230812 RepID=A0A8H7CLE1_9AGAR|nr:hypothetical protein MSAN_02175800 [Mycena sanguinolenta]